METGGLSLPAFLCALSYGQCTYRVPCVYFGLELSMRWRLGQAETGEQGMFKAGSKVKCPVCGKRVQVRYGNHGLTPHGCAADGAASEHTALVYGIQELEDLIPGWEYRAETAATRKSLRAGKRQLAKLQAALAAL